MEGTVLSTRGLRKSYGGREVVAGLDLTLRRGECYGLLGPNGAGKTTTLRMLLGLTGPSAGEISLLGHAVPADARVARARVGVVPQMDNLDPDFTVRENLVVYGRYFGLTKAEVEAKVPRLLSLAALETRADARIQSLSGGMKRRLVLARALVNDPELIFLDEPTTGLDPQARHVMWERLRLLLREGRTILLTTHFMDEAERLCDRLGVIDHGRMLAEGTPRELIAAHIEPEVVEVYGEGVEAWHAGPAKALADRAELHGETAFCYVREAGALVEALKGEERLRFLHRRANLEDLFLKLTGREMRE
ncbi:MAG TPA: ATP-binding cassette domain-containing protein [Usitatibacteraceae bacterium]|nr:nodulation factor ABC transporter ATP-binding protein NodI [Verrucomicrobiales bacterium]HRE13295.1 ATP-binding cassette domain-containing protein [Usitatibacteraceae bacterium]